MGNNHTILIDLSDVDGKAIDNAIEIRALGTNQAIARTLDAIQDFIDGMVHCSLSLIIDLPLLQNKYIKALYKNPILRVKF